jgi:hypothetical protein
MATSMREEIEVGSLAIRFLVEGEESGGSVAVFEFDVPAGAKVAAGHSHDGYEETIYGLEGVLTWTIEGTPIDVGPGEALCIPRHRCEGARGRNTRHPRPGLLPRGSGHPRRRGRWPARFRGVGRGHAQTRTHLRRVSSRAEAGRGPV